MLDDLVTGMGIAAFLPVAVLLTLTPGADTALVTWTTLRFGSRAALITTTGICCAVVVQGAASGLGLSALIAASSQAFLVLRFCGAAYLIWLGIRSWVRSSVGDEPQANRHVSVESAWRRFREGFLSNILNPKVIVFYLALLPQFISPDNNILAQSILLAGIHAVLGLVWLSLYSRAVSKLARRMSTTVFKRWAERISGSVLVVLGLKVAATSK